jgi:hypothetical protein
MTGSYESPPVRSLSFRMATDEGELGETPALEMVRANHVTTWTATHKVEPRLVYRGPLTIGLAWMLSSGKWALGVLEGVGDWPPDESSDSVPSRPALIVMCFTSCRLDKLPWSKSVLNHNVTKTYVGAPAVKVEHLLVFGPLLCQKFLVFCGRHLNEAWRNSARWHRQG